MPEISTWAAAKAHRLGGQRRQRRATQEVTQFAAAKRLTYIGDHVGATLLTRDLMNVSESGVSADGGPQATRETEHGAFVGTEEFRLTPDGHELRMFRGVERTVYAALRRGIPSAKVHPKPSALAEGDIGFDVESVELGDAAAVRSISTDGSLFEVSVR